MAYGDITGSPDAYRAPGKPGIQTVRRAVILKDSSTIGSAAINYLDNLKDLNALTTVAHTENNAGLYIGTAGNVCVNLSGQKKIIENGKATGSAVTNDLIDTTQNFNSTVQKRDLVINTTDGTVAFVGAVDSDTALSLVDASNSAVDIMAEGELYEIHRPIVFQNIAAGSFLPLEISRIFAIATTADDIMAIYQSMPLIGIRSSVTHSNQIINADTRTSAFNLRADFTELKADSNLFTADANKM